MSHKIAALQSITMQMDCVTVSPNVVQGGAVSNIIPDECRLVVDSRFTRVADLECLKDIYRRYSAHSRLCKRYASF